MASSVKAPLQKRVSSFGNARAKTPAGKEKKAATPTRPPQKVQNTSKLTGSKQQTYSTEAEERFEVVLRGDFTDLPPMPRSSVRIFLSSTFSDMRAERNALAREAYPQLRDFCADLNLSFQVVDLRWGVTSDAANNHLTTKICLLELENCQKVSLGPSCIALIGNRYGYCPLPYNISVEEYRVLRQEITENGGTGGSVMDKWYLRDDNVLPPAYILQPIMSHLPNYLNNTPGCEEKRQADIQIWTETEDQLVTAIHQAATSACEKGRLSPQRKQFYLMSVTEHEARKGILDAVNPTEHGLLFLRELTGLDSSAYCDSMASRHKDLVNTMGKFQEDTRAREMISSLKEELSSCLGSNNTHSYSVPWIAGGIQPEANKDHQAYLTGFCEDFVKKVQELITNDKQAKESLIRQREYYSQYSETLHHAHFCQLKCQSFCGQQDILEKIKSYILDPGNRKPFVLHAQSGAGKTSVMAMAMNSLKSWINEKHIGMIRFLGTSPLSTDIYCALRSICGQLADNADVIMEPQSYKTMKALSKYVPRFFRSMSLALKQHVVIFLDSLDQLEADYNAYTGWWLPTVLPVNFKLIISTLPKEHGILDNLRPLVSQEENFVELPLLPITTSKEIVLMYLTSKKHTLTEEQMTNLLDTFSKSPNALYLKLLMDQSLFWQSHTPVAEITLPDSARIAISNLFDQLEKKFGVKFVQAALGLITAGLNGLSEIELEDALSCVDEALVEIYKFHDPPVQGTIRVPPVMWARLRYDIQEYLVERQSQGQTTLYWYHRQFIEVASERYTKGTKGQQLHKILFELFSVEHGMKRDITLTQRKNLHIPNADRNTTPQPMSATNIRKLECLTYHLKRSLNALDLDYGKQTTYCNLAFIRAKVASIGVDSFIKEVEDFLNIQPDKEVEEILTYINICKSSLRDPVAFSFSIMAFLKSTPEQKNIETLRMTAMDCLRQNSRTMLIPTYPCLAPRAGEPDRVYDGLSHVFVQNNGLVLLANIWGLDSDAVVDKDVTLATLDLMTTDLSKYVCEQIDCEPYMTPNGKDLFYLSEAEQVLVKISVEGMQTKKPLTEITGLQINNISTLQCMISGSEDSKLLAIAVGDKVALLSYPKLNSVSSFNIEHTSCITNLHCCSSCSSVIVTGNFTKEEDPSVKGIIVMWDSVSKKMKSVSKTNFKIDRNASGLTPGDEYHICYGMAGTQSVIEVRRIKNAEAFDPILVTENIKSMTISPTDQEAMFQIGDNKIQILNVETRNFVKSLSHSTSIIIWDMSWEEENLLVADETNTVTLYNKQFEKKKARKGHVENIKWIGTYQGQMMMLTSENKAKIWNQKDYFSMESMTESSAISNVDETNNIGLQNDVTCFAISVDSQELFTFGKNRKCKVWSFDNSLKREFPVDVSATHVYTVLKEKLVVFDTDTKKVVIYTSSDGSKYCDSLPENIMCLTIMKDRSKIILLVMESKPTLYIYDVVSNSSTRKFSVNINIKFISSTLTLTPSERYAILKLEVSKKEYDSIAAMWTKGQYLPKQRHPYRFVAVDLSQSTGAPFYACHRLSKVPHLGVTVEPYLGNSVMVSSRRWVMFWDIPTGSCDQTMCKSTRKTKMYRPDWVGASCLGSNDVIRLSKDQKYVAVGSQDGYLFVYAAETGMPPGLKAPVSKHPSPVNQVCFNTAGSLVASACTGGYLKLWEPKTGNCIFSAPMGTELRQLAITGDGTKLVAISAAEKSHILIFHVKEASC